MTLVVNDKATRDFLGHTVVKNAKIANCVTLLSLVFLAMPWPYRPEYSVFMCCTSCRKIGNFPKYQD